MALRRPRLDDQPRQVAAAAATVSLEAASSWRTWKFGNRDWQAEGWRLYDIVPEHRFLSNWIGDSVSQCRLYVAEVGETGEETGEVTDERIARLAAVPLGTGAQRDDNLRLAGIDLAVGGECWIVGEGVAEDPENTQGSWFVVTSGAFKREGDQVKVRRPKVQGGAGDWLDLRDGTDILTRCWRPHPNDVDQADSPTRSAIVPLREIELLTKREFAELDSRLTGAGVWFLPEGLDFPRKPEDPAGIAGFMAYLQRLVAASMRGQGEASSMVPAMATVPDQFIEHLDKLRPVTLWSELSAEITPMKDKAIVRVASSFEIPSEHLLGLSTANHWTAWAISEEGVKRIRTYLATLSDALTRGFLRLALERMKVPDPDRYAFAFDTAPLAARPNRLDEAIQLNDRLLLSDEETVKAGAFDPDQMPTDDERVKMLVFRAVTQNPALIADPAVQEILGIRSISVPAAPAPSALPPAEEDEPDEEGPPEQNEPDDEQPAPGTARAGLGLELDRRIAQLAVSPRQVPPPTPQHVFNAASKLLVIAALERAGARLTTTAERRRYAGVHRHELHTRVGPITPEKATRVLFDAWVHVPSVAADLGVEPSDLERLLHGYVMELLTRGMAHHDDFLFAALQVAHRGRGLEPELVAT